MMQTTYETSSKTLVNNSIIVSVALGIFAIILLAVTAIMGAIMLGVDFVMWASAAILAGAALSIAGILLRAWDNARWVIVQTIAADIAKRDAEAEKLNAEADAIRAAAERATVGTQVLNVNSGSGTMNVKAKPITYRVNGQIVNGNQLNQNQIDARSIHIEAADVRWFVEQLASGYGHAKSKWLSVRDAEGKTKAVELPYSRLPMTYEIYKALIDALADAGAIVGRGERASGTLIERSPAQLVKMIEASYPQASSKGMTIDLSPTATA